jgi:hypothetical protein
VALVVLLATAFVGWVVWAALGAAAPSAAARVAGFEVTGDDRIEVRVQAAAGSSGRFACRVRALDRSRDVVGVATVRLDADRPRGVERRVTVRTRGRAVTATVGDCAPTA